MIQPLAITPSKPNKKPLRGMFGTGRKKSAPVDNSGTTTTPTSSDAAKDIVLAASLDASLASMNNKNNANRKQKSKSEQHKTAAPSAPIVSSENMEKGAFQDEEETGLVDSDDYEDDDASS